MGEGEDQPQKFAKVENPPGLSSDSRQIPGNMITLDTLMMEIQRGNVEGASRHRELTGSLSNVERQLEGVKTTAAKALCTAEETKHEMTNLRARVDALERGGGGSSAASTVCSEPGEKNVGGKHRYQQYPSSDPWWGWHSTTKTAQQYDMGKARIELLGGEQGRELIVGGFPVWPKKEDLEKWVADHMLPAFPEELRPQVERVNYPGKRISLVVVVMKSVGTPKENRQLMFKTIKAFNAVKPTFQARGEEHRLWAGPSKPQHLREEDNLVSEALGIAKILFKGREGELDHDYTRQRLFVGERLLASRPPGSQRLEFREEVLVSSIPGYTVEVLNNAREEVKKARLAKRAKS